MKPTQILARICKDENLDGPHPLLPHEPYPYVKHIFINIQIRFQQVARPYETNTNPGPYMQG